jgi:hypothetical protein
MQSDTFRFSNANNTDCRFICICAMLQVGRLTIHSFEVLELLVNLFYSRCSLYWNIMMKNSWWLEESKRVVVHVFCHINFYFYLIIESIRTTHSYVFHYFYLIFPISWIIYFRFRKFGRSLTERVGRLISRRYELVSKIKCNFIWWI